MSEQGTQKSDGLSRRDFLRLMGAAGTGLAFAPFIPFGNYMPNPSSSTLEKVKVILPDGTQANVNTYPLNFSEVITYPATGDPALDDVGFGIKFPKGINGANASPVPAAPINLRKSRLDNPSDFCVPCSDIQACVLAKLLINLVQLFV